MGDNFGGRHLRRSNRKLLALGLALWLGAAAGAVAARRYLYNVLFGPFPLDGAALSRITDPEERWQYYVTVPAEGMERFVARGYTGGNRQPYATYAFLPATGQRLLLRVATDAAGPNLTGPLERLSDFERDHLLAPLQRTDSPLGNKFLPFRMDATTYFRTVGYYLAVLPLSFLAVLGAWLVGLALLRMPGPSRPRQEAE
jgi:hypothetical protein